MKVIEDRQDKYKRYPIWVPAGTRIQDIQEWLYRHYQGYKFAIVFDETGDEWEPCENPFPVYFADDVLDEIALYSDAKIIRRV